MLHPLNGYAVTNRLQDLRDDRKTAQLKRVGYRDLREPRMKRHWANR